MIRMQSPLYPHIPCRLGSVAGSAVACCASARVCATAEDIPCLLGGVAGQSVCGACGASPARASYAPVPADEDGCRAGGACPMPEGAASPRRILPTPGCMACKFRR